MREIYLVQRGKIINAEKDDKGIDSHVSFQYMGSSEYEWGALPKSLRRMKETKLYLSKITLKGKDFWCLRPESINGDEFIKKITALSNDKVRLKESISFPFHFGISKYDRGEDLWWDIENDFMFSFNKMFMKRLQAYICNSMKE